MKALARGASWIAIGASAAAMLVFTWGSWPNLQVDFGRELYVPWRLAEGEVLYRDIPWFDGPLSAYWNASVFRVLGVGLRSLVAVNLAIVALFVVLLHALIARTNDRIAATTACLVFVLLFAFCRIDTIGNDNYLTPYSHGVTHGLVLSLLALVLFGRRDRGRYFAAVGSGLAVGLAALTKAEVLLAAAAALCVAWALDALVRHRARALETPSAARRAPDFVALAVFGGSVLVPPALALLLLAGAMPLREAAAGTLGTWSSLAGSSVASQHFYRETFGSRELLENLRALMLVGAGWVAAFGLPPALALFVARTPGADREAPKRDVDAPPGTGWLLATGAAGAAFLATLSAGDFLRVSWPDVLRPLPVVMLALAFPSAARIARGQGTVQAQQRDVSWLALLVFSFVLLAKIALRVRLDQYGFALAMPATLCGVAAFVTRMPEWVASRGGDRRATRAAALGVVAAVVLSFAPIVATRVSERTLPIGRGVDEFLTEPGKEAARSALRAIDALPSGASLAVLPEGVMLNYLARRTNPTGIVNFMPPELIVFGEARILAAFAANPPDYIALMHKDTQEYGVDFFGQGYGRELYAWIRRNYAVIERFGDPPLEVGSVFGVEILAYRPPE